MYYLGQLVVLKKGLKYIRAVVVDIDATFVTLRLDYKQSIGTTIKVSKDSKDILKFDFKPKSSKLMNTEAFESNNNDDLMA